MTDTVTIIAKGKTAENADLFIRACPGTAVACINDSAILLRPGIVPNYCFFSDVGMAKAVVESGREHHRYISRLNDNFPSKLPTQFPFDKWDLCYAESCGASMPQLESQLISGRICWHHTTPGAIHWLAKNDKFRKIRIIGVPLGDEPHVRANGVTESQEFMEEMNKKNNGNFFHQWNEVTDRVCNLMSRVYGVEIERYEDNHPS